MATRQKAPVNEGIVIKAKPLDKAIDWKKLTQHQIAKDFMPPTTDEDARALDLDIKLNGQHQEIILFEGKVLDGWSRYQACRRLGKQPTFKVYEGTDPLAVVYGTNVVRRKLSSVQKAVFGAKLYLATRGTPNQKRQVDIRKMIACGMEQMNQVINLFEQASAKKPKALAAVKRLEADAAKLTPSQLTELLVQSETLDPNSKEMRTRAAAAAAAALPSGDPGAGDPINPLTPEQALANAVFGADGDIDADLDASADDDNDLDDAEDGQDEVGLDIAELAGDDDDGDTPAAPTRRTPAGDNVIDINASRRNGLGDRKRVGHDRDPSAETGIGLANRFKKLPAAERAKFVGACFSDLKTTMELWMASHPNASWPWAGKAASTEPGAGAMAAIAGVAAPAEPAPAKGRRGAAKAAKGAAAAESEAAPAKAARAAKAPAKKAPAKAAKPAAKGKPATPAKKAASGAAKPPAGAAAKTARTRQAA